MEYAVVENGHKTFFGTYEECCDYLDNVALGWESGIHDVSIVPCDED